MNKKVFIALGLFLAVFTGSVSAKTIGLNLDIGGVYNYHQIRHEHSQGGNGYFASWTIRSKHMGGFQVGISYELPKNWLIYASTMFSFNYTFVNDTQFGFGYVFKPAKWFNLFAGGGLAVGGSLFEKTAIEKYTNIGGGIKLEGFHMFTNSFGLFLAFNLNLYKPINGLYNKKASSPYMATSTNLALGAKIRF